jgi:hypothetical protein
LPSNSSATLAAGCASPLKKRNPQFFVIQYRLGLGLGRRTQIRFGDRWVNEWPPNPQPRWFGEAPVSRVTLGPRRAAVLLH